MQRKRIHRTIHPQRRISAGQIPRKLTLDDVLEDVGLLVLDNPPVLRQRVRVVKRSDVRDTQFPTDWPSMLVDSVAAVGKDGQSYIIFIVDDTETTP